MTLRTFTLYKSLLILCFVSISSIYFSQLSNFNSPKNWKKNMHELVLNVGTTAFLGELGGRDMVGTDYSLADLDLPSTSLNIGFSYRYRFHPYFATSSIISIGQIKGDDALTLEPVRNARNLNFKSIVISAYQRIECLVYFRELFGHKYNFKNLKGKKNRNEQVYLFSGLGITYFNPQGNYNGTWTSLRPLHTEGQGFPGRPDEYLPITAIVPFGLGFRVGIDRMWRIGMEFTYFKTFTDYMDDVSTTGFDTDLLADKYGPEAAFLSNPAKTEEHKAWFGNGQQRGDAKQKDAYFYANVVVVRNITYKTKSPRRPTIKWKGMRAKF